MRAADAANPFPTLPVCDCPFDDCSACSRPPGCPTLILRRAIGGQCGRESTLTAQIACRNTGSTNDRAAECSCATANAAQMECAGTQSGELPRAHASRSFASAACDRCVLPCARL